MITYTKTSITTEPRLIIQHDEDAESPRQWDNLGYFITVDRNHTSPDSYKLQHDKIRNIIMDTAEDATDQNDHIERITKEINEQTTEKVLAIYPVVKHEHGNVVYRLATQHGFDYSNNGFYIVTDKTANLLGTPKEDFERVIKGELETYTQWVNGEVYGFTLYNEDGTLDNSCWGYYDIEDIRGELPEEFKNEDLTAYLK